MKKTFICGQNICERQNAGWTVREQKNVNETLWTLLVSNASWWRRNVTKKIIALFINDSLFYFYYFQIINAFSSLGSKDCI
jgi:hypothetical protein